MIEVNDRAASDKLCISKDNKVLLLKKPRRNWWVAPGGKMEPGESVKESCIREFREETGSISEIQI